MRCMLLSCVWALGLLFAVAARGDVQPMDAAALAQQFRAENQPVEPLADGTIVCEAEEFRVGDSAWRAMNWGTNYYAATFANTFLSRKAYLSAPPECEPSDATRHIRVGQPGRYLVLARYEAAFRFETQFRVRIAQGGKTVFDRLYGARSNPKVWAFRQKVQPEVQWSWGAVENVVWEGHDAAVNLQAGTAVVTLTAQRQPGDAARRNVDLLLLTPHAEEVAMRLEKENYLPLDGLLTQEGDVYLRLHNQSTGNLILTIPPCTEHSPYWVHLRKWKPQTLQAAANATTQWTEVGSLLDTLSDGQWVWSAKGDAPEAPLKYRVEVGVRGADGKIAPIRAVEGTSAQLRLAFDANTRYTRRIRLPQEILAALVQHLKQHPVPGKLPQQTLIYGYTFEPMEGQPEYNSLVAEFTGLFNLTPTTATVQSGGAVPRGYIDVRYLNLTQLEEHCQKLVKEGVAPQIACVSLGDEISLPAPPATDHEGFRNWLQQQNADPRQVDPASGGDWQKIQYAPQPATADSKPALYYFSRRYAEHHGIQQQKQRTDILRRYLPNAGIGANFSPHHPPEYIGEVHKWVTLFRRQGMTMPWSEDYIWQIPVGSQQMNFMNLDLCRAGIKHHPQAKIHFYVMPHWPGNTPRSWRRQFYGDLAHGMKIVNLFEFRPVQAAYTENHVSLPEMYREVRRAFCELGTFEDLVQAGQVSPGVIALWRSEAGDVWHDHDPPFGAGLRTLYVALRHLQLPLDIVVEEDALAGELRKYRVLYLADRHVSRAASRAIADWVASGGRLFATAGAGLWDEFNQPNEILQNLYGIRPTGLEADAELKFVKQDLPFAKQLQTIACPGLEGTLPVVGACARFELAGAEAAGTFADGKPAVARRAHGKGEVLYCGFLPGLTYFQPAIPRRPADRGSSDDAMAHFVPTQFDLRCGELLGRLAADLPRAVECSDPLVETTKLVAPGGVLIPLVNFRGQKIDQLEVRLRGPLPGKSAALASGTAVQQSRDGDTTIFRFPLDVADALILR